MIGNLIREPPTCEGVSVSKKKRHKDPDDQGPAFVEYLDIPISFDCETYSFLCLRPDGKTTEKRAIMWAWGLAIGDACYMGRTWPELIEATDTLRAAYGLGPYRRIIIYVHNLSYDFQFFRKWYHWDTVFALKSREVCYCCTGDGIEFRCSYILTGYSLEKVGEHLTSHTIKKLSGTIDYKTARHSKTPLTDAEIAYLEHDCLVVTAHIAEQIEVEGGIASIPLTKTGYVRRYVQKACFRDPTKKASRDPSRMRYRGFIENLYLDDFIYQSLNRAFQGGYTHANPFYAGEVMEHVRSFDFASAYPSVICSELFPITPPQRVQVPDWDTFKDCLDHYCCVFTIELWDVKPRTNIDHYLSASRCIFPDGGMRQESNGRIVKADKLITTITNVDYIILTHCYTFKIKYVTGMIRWGKGYLPKPIIDSCLYFFKAKTELKGQEGKEQEYLSAKEMLNSIYGMFVQNPLRPVIPYDLDKNEWGEERDGLVLLERRLEGEEIIEALEEYNTGMGRFTYFAWGVFITAYCRRNLWRGILEFGDDYVYSDTDSIKCINADRHTEYIETYNQYVQAKIKACLEYSHIDPSLAYAETIDHKIKALGVWEDEGEYSRFKTLGAKRYMTEKDGKVSITVSGVNKKEAIPYILSKDCDPFDFFQDEMTIPAGYAGKMIPFYGDDMIEGCIRDYMGNIAEYKELSYEYMEDGGYTMKLSSMYVQYLDYLRKGGV